jgi:hypothetical protein
MAIWNLALIFFHPSTCNAHELAQSACSVHAVRMQCASTCSVHAHAVCMHMQCACTCSAHAVCNHESCVHTYPVSIHTLCPMAVQYICSVQLCGVQLCRGAEAHLHAARFDHSEQRRASALRYRAYEDPIHVGQENGPPPASSMSRFRLVVCCY